MWAIGRMPITRPGFHESWIQGFLHRFTWVIGVSYVDVLLIGTERDITAQSVSPNHQFWDPSWFLGTTILFLCFFDFCDMPGNCPFKCPWNTTKSHVRQTEILGKQSPKNITRIFPSDLGRCEYPAVCWLLCHSSCQYLGPRSTTTTNPWNSDPSKLPLLNSRRFLGYFLCCPNNQITPLLRGQDSLVLGGIYAACNIYTSLS